MSNAWLGVPLEDYEGHMSAAGVEQLPVLSELFRHALGRCRPRSVAVLGVAGGNGLEHIDSAVTHRVVGIDINQSFLDEVHRRYPSTAGLELRCCDLRNDELNLAPVDLVHAALVFEHAGLDRALENAVRLVAPSGMLCVVLQLPSATEQAVAATRYTSMQRVKEEFALINVGEFERLVQQRGFRLVEQETRPVPGGKAFCFGVFGRDR